MTSYGMDEDKMYYHCCGCGRIYADKEKTKLIARIYTKTLPRVLEEFTISTGICKMCIKERLESRVKKK